MAICPLPFCREEAFAGKLNTGFLLLFPLKQRLPSTLSSPEKSRGQKYGLRTAAGRGSGQPFFYRSCSEAAMAISRAASISFVFSAGFFLAEIL